MAIFDCRMHTVRLPPDLLYAEWFMGKREETWDVVRGKTQYVYHKNLLDHVGEHSSFAVRAKRLPFPRCFASMADVWSIQNEERFQVSIFLKAVGKSVCSEAFRCCMLSR